MTHDYIIVGAGTAGCVLANRLSADPDASVLLLEAGGKDDYFWIDIPVGYLYTIGNPRTDWCYRIEPDPGLNGRTIGYARGRVLGGCSSINAMIYMRGQRSDYDHWASLGNRGWGWDDVLPVFKRSEDYQHGADEWHGVGGEMRVEERRVSWEILDAWRRAAEECGIPRIAEFNRGDNFGNAYFQMNQRGGRRWSGTKAFLRPVMHRPNLTVRTDAQVRCLAVEAGDAGPRATGIEMLSGERLTARREVILAAGAIGSPQILQLSGIGPGALLQRARHRRRPRPGRGRREPARPPADPQHLQGEEHRHAEPAGELAVRQGGDGAGVSAVQDRPADDAPVAARRFRPQRSVAAVGEHRVARAAALARQVRRPAAQVQRDHAVGRQPAADQPRARPHQGPGPAAGAGHHPQLPVHRRGPAGRGGRPAVHPPHHGRTGPDAVRAAGMAARSRGRQRRGAGACGRGPRHDDLPSRRNLQDGPRPAGRRRRPARRAWRVRPAGHRRLGDAPDHVGQHQRAHRDDRREGSGVRARGRDVAR